MCIAAMRDQLRCAIHILWSTTELTTRGGTSHDPHPGVKVYEKSIYTPTLGRGRTMSGKDMYRSRSWPAITGITIILVVITTVPTVVFLLENGSTVRPSS